MSEPLEIIGTDLTDVRIKPCGEIVALGFKDASGRPITLALPHQALGMLLMTLPHLIEMSLRERTGDASLRNVYPVGDWRVEAASDGKSLLLSLATPDGFAVSFCLLFNDAQRLGRVLTDVTPRSAPAGAPPTLRPAVGTTAALVANDGRGRQMLVRLVAGAFVAVAAWPAPAAWAQPSETTDQQNAAEFRRLYESWRQVQDPEERINEWARIHRRRRAAT